MRTDTTAQACTKKGEAAGLWAVMWRSVVYLPVTVAVGATWLIVGLGLIMLPLAIAIYAYVHLWKHTLVLCALWVVLFTLWRYFISVACGRIHRRFYDYSIPRFRVAPRQFVQQDAAANAATRFVAFLYVLSSCLG